MKASHTCRDAVRLPGGQPIVLAALLFAVACARGDSPPRGGMVHLEDWTDVRDFVGRCDRAPCPKLLYLMSPSMPLSVTGLVEATEVAWQLGWPMGAVAADNLLHGTSIDLGPLFSAGAFAHLPALLITAGNGGFRQAILGFRTAEAYLRMIDPASSSEAHVSQLLAKHLTSSTSVVLGAYFRHWHDTDYISYSAGGQNILHNLETDEAVKVPGSVDFIPDATGRLFITPAPARGGLQFYSASKLRHALEQGEPLESIEPDWLDRLMRDQYPSASAIGDPPDPDSQVFRVLTSWWNGVAIRDYHIQWSTDGSIRSIVPRGLPRSPCPERQLSLPVLAPKGESFAARDDADGVMKIWQITDGQGCRPVHTLVRHAGKVAFSSNGQLVAFSLQGPGSAFGSGMATSIWVYDLRSKAARRVETFIAGRAVTFPDILADTAVVWMQVDGAGLPRWIVKSIVP